MRMSFYRDGIVTRWLHTGVLVGFICILLFGTSSQAATLRKPRTWGCALGHRIYLRLEMQCPQHYGSD